MTSRLLYRATKNPPRGFRAYPTRLHDGDSFWVICDTGFGGRHEPELRLIDVSAPEVRPVQEGSAETTEFVNVWLSEQAARLPFRYWPLWVSVVMTTAYEPEMKQSFTRYLATVWPFGMEADPAASLNAALIALIATHPEWPTGD